MNVDFKITIWNRLIDVPEELIPRIQSGEIDSSTELCEIMDDMGLECTWETLYDSEEPMFPNENGGCPTIEIMDDNGKVTWNNGDKSEEE